MSFFSKDQAFFATFSHLPSFTPSVKLHGVCPTKAKGDRDTPHPLRGSIENNDIWSFLSFKGTPLSMSEICRRSGVPIEGKQEGEGQPFRGWKG
jgi:hypothetical protein